MELFYNDRGTGTRDKGKTTMINKGAFVMDEGQMIAGKKMCLKSVDKLRLSGLTISDHSVKTIFLIVKIDSIGFDIADSNKRI